MDRRRGDHRASSHAAAEARDASARPEVAHAASRYDIAGSPLRLTASLGNQRRLEAALVQFRRTTGERSRSSASDVANAADSGVQNATGALPHLDAIQKSFGSHDVAGIGAAIGGQAAASCDALSAEAYATGSKVAFRRFPDVHTAAHEAAHVVQQRTGVALKGGIGAAGDAYERHADQVADAVVHGQSAEALLDNVPGGGTTGVQRKLLGSVSKEAKQYWLQIVDHDEQIQALNADSNALVDIQIEDGDDEDRGETKVTYIGKNKDKIVIQITLYVDREQDSEAHILETLLHETVLHALPAYALFRQTAPQDVQSTFSELEEEEFEARETSEHEDGRRWMQALGVARSISQEVYRWALVECIGYLKDVDKQAAKSAYQFALSEFSKLDEESTESSSSDEDEESPQERLSRGQAPMSKEKAKEVLGQLGLKWIEFESSGGDSSSSSKGKGGVSSMLQELDDRYEKFWTGDSDGWNPQTNLFVPETVVRQHARLAPGTLIYVDGVLFRVLYSDKQTQRSSAVKGSKHGKYMTLWYHLRGG